MAEYANATFEPRGGPRRIWPWVVVVAALALGGLALAYAVYWYGAADAVEAAIEDWTKAREAEGFTASHGAITITGFPWWFRVAVEDAALARTEPQPWSWRTGRLSGAARPWSPRRIHLEAPGPHDIAFRDRGVPRVLTLAARELAVELTLSKTGRVARVETTAHGLRIVSEALLGAIGASRLDVSYQGAGEESPARFSVHARDLALPIAGANALAPTIARIGGEATVSGVFPPGPIDASVAAWRDNGGAIDVAGLRLEWGPLRVESDGTLAIDEDMRPIGAFGLRVLGLSETITALTEADVISPQNAAIIRISTSILAQETDGGRLEFSITAQSGKLFVGPVAVWNIPPLALPQSPRRPAQ